jgi:hypothetical protein
MTIKNRGTEAKKIYPFVGNPLRMKYYSNAGGISPVAGILTFPSISIDASVAAIALVQSLHT